MGERSDAEALIDLGRDYYRAMLEADDEAIRRLFDPRASIIGHWEGTLVFDGVEAFIATTPQARTGDRPFTCRVESLAITGDVAVIAVGNACYGVWFTDYLSCVKSDDRWRIVAKTYYAHADGVG